MMVSDGLKRLMHGSFPLVVGVVMLSGCAMEGTSGAASKPLAEVKPAVPVAPVDDGYVKLFNGKDLTGWGYPSGEKFDGLTEVPGEDRRFKVVDGLLTCIARVPPQRTRELRTTETFAGDFVLKLEFRASVRADSGIYVRGKQLQCRDYSTMGPYRSLTKYKPQEWNEVEIVVKGGTALCTCNGEVLEAAMVVPATGGIGLESDGGIMEYRNIRLKRMP